MDGTRESKTVGNVKHEYITLGGKLVREVWGTAATIDYLYDNNGSPYQVTVKDGTSTYTGYFVLNQQGDVIALVDGIGAVLVTYSYDAWGRQISYTASGTNGAKLYTYNRLKYRSYYYDSDLQMYDLGSRFYDPVLGRFINGDGLLLAGDVLGMNLYAYCENNPVMLCDSTGTRPIASERIDNETPEERSTSIDSMKTPERRERDRRQRERQKRSKEQKEYEERNMFAAVVYAEAGGENTTSKRAVAHVINNRIGREDRWSSLRVVLTNGEFDGYGNKKYDRAMKYYCTGVCDDPVEKRAMQESRQIIMSIYEGTEADFTGGALYFNSNASPYDWECAGKYELIDVPGTENFWFYR